MTPFDAASSQTRPALIDGFGRTVTYLRVSVTDRCDLRCVYCMAEHMTFLPKADVLLFGHILHDWDLDTKRMLLRKAYSALPKGGAVVVYDSIIDDARKENAFGLLMSLNMLIETRGGFD